MVAGVPVRGVEAAELVEDTAPPFVGDFVGDLTESLDAVPPEAALIILCLFRAVSAVTPAPVPTPPPTADGRGLTTAPPFVVVAPPTALCLPAVLLCACFTIRTTDSLRMKMPYPG